MPLEKEDFTFKPIEVDQGSTKQFIIKKMKTKDLQKWNKKLND
jgi:hypothetical protein